MSYTFSENLRNRLIEYFLRVHGKTISHEEADLYLDSMAGLYSAFSKKNAREEFSAAKRMKIFSAFSS